VTNPEKNSPHLDVTEALNRIRTGQMVIVVDDEDRENEGDLTMAGDLVTGEAINFMATHGRGLICLALTSDRVDELRLPMMTSDNRSTRGTAFTTSIDAREGVTTGISASERAHTVRIAVDPKNGPETLVMPGHTFPLRARTGGVLVRSGHTEAAIDLARLAGRAEAGVICEIMRDDGEMARMPDLEAFANKHGLGIVHIADLIQYRLAREMLIEEVESGEFVPRGSLAKTPYRRLRYKTPVEDTQYLALVLGNPSPERPTLVRVQVAQLLRDVFSNGNGPLGWLRMIEEAGEGVFLYVLPADTSAMLDSGIGATKSANAERAGQARSDSPLRDFGLGAQVLARLGVRQIRLLTDHPRRIAGLDGFGIQVVDCVASRSAT